MSECHGYVKFRGYVSVLLGFVVTFKNIKEMSLITNISSKLIRGNLRFMPLVRKYSTNDTSSEQVQGGYAKAFAKFETLTEEPKQENQTFASLLRSSKFIDVSFFLMIE